LSASTFCYWRSNVADRRRGLPRRSVPIIAVLPILTLLFGRNLTGTIVIVAIVVFAPSLVLVLDGLRAAPDDLLALTIAYNASPSMLLRKVRVPTALPSMFAALRIACPLAFIGALLAEWLATGKGLGYLMLTATTESKYADLWAAAILTTSVAVAAYALTDALERAVISHIQPVSR
jgi:ABC-type nitrate/sulfonate/bicarbonate transport system permease component